MLANILPLHTPIDPWVRGQRVIYLFRESSHVAYQINRDEAESAMQAKQIFLPFYTPTKIVSEYDQEIPQSQTADKPVAS